MSPLKQNGVLHSDSSVKARILNCQFFTADDHNGDTVFEGPYPVNMTVQIRYRICTIFYRFVPAVPDIGARHKNGTVLISASITGQYRLSGTGQYRFHTNIQYRDITVHQFWCYQQGTFCSQN